MEDGKSFTGFPKHSERDAVNVYCRAYTYTTPAAGSYCYLKSAAGGLAANEGFVTGAKLTGKPLYLVAS